MPHFLSILLVLIVISMAFGLTKTPLVVPVTANPQNRGMTLDDPTDTLLQDDDLPRFAFRFPDVFGDDLRNQRFQIQQPGRVVGAMFAFPTRNMQQWTSGDPQLIVKVWRSDTNRLPMADAELLSDTIPFADYSNFVYSLDTIWRGQATQFVIVNFGEHAVRVDSGFHIGYTALRNSADDSLAILSDDGEPATENASEYYRSHFVLMRDGWGGVNFFIRALVEMEGSNTLLLNSEGMAADFQLFPPFPNPLNAAATIAFNLPQAGRVSLTLYDLLGRRQADLLYADQQPGYHSLHWNASDVGSGSYWLSLRSSAGIRNARIVVLK
jgi:hypothetical protein